MNFKLKPKRIIKFKNNKLTLSKDYYFCYSAKYDTCLHIKHVINYADFKYPLITYVDSFIIEDANGKFYNGEVKISIYENNKDYVCFERTENSKELT